MVDKDTEVKATIGGGYLSNFTFHDGDGNVREYIGRVRVKRYERVTISCDLKKDIAIVSLTRRRIFRRKKEMLNGSKDNQRHQVKHLSQPE